MKTLGELMKITADASALIKQRAKLGMHEPVEEERWDAKAEPLDSTERQPSSEQQPSWEQRQGRQEGVSKSEKDT